MQTELERPGAGGAATGPGSSKLALRLAPHTLPLLTEQGVLAMVALHIGKDWLSGWAAGRGA